MSILAHLNLHLLVSYNMLLGMVDWLYLHRNKVECYDKAIECLDDMDKRESWRVRKRQHQLEWLHLCKQSAVIGKGVCYL